MQAGAVRTPSLVGLKVGLKVGVSATSGDAPGKATEHNSLGMQGSTAGENGEDPPGLQATKGQSSAQWRLLYLDRF